MLRVSLPILIEMYVLVLLIGIGVLWLLAGWARKRRERQVLLYRFQCIICAFPFEDKSDDPLPRCPKCGSLNDRPGCGKTLRRKRARIAR